jgi:hypothetical protein
VSASLSCRRLRLWSASLSGERLRAGVAVLVLVLGTGCRSDSSPQPPPAPKDVVIWKTVGSWSGRGARQTETFTSDTGGFRVRWETKNAARPGGGHLHVIFRSGDSGREIIDAVDVRGEGRDIEEVSAERPRWYYLSIDSADVDWTLTVDERIDAHVSERSTQKPPNTQKPQNTQR